MKYLTTIVLILAGLNLKADTIQLGSDLYTLRDSQESSAQSIAEYTLTNETLHNWRTLVAIRQFKNENSHFEYIKRLAQTYRNSYPHMSFAANKDETRDIYWVDFIVYPRKGSNLSKGNHAEWNFFAARAHSSGGVIVFQYAKRIPITPDLETALKKLDVKRLREEMMPVLTKHEF